mmetsp:Transcript_9906/g.20002  ORF Transcript_9906/g.20002 Transcript_9906/m.20002 type:complete len:370 (+) Transcript_9906:2164-3273(+)
MFLHFLHPQKNFHERVSQKLAHQSRSFKVLLPSLATFQVGRQLSVLGRLKVKEVSLHDAAGQERFAVLQNRLAVEKVVDGALGRLLSRDHFLQFTHRGARVDPLQFNRRLRAGAGSLALKGSVDPKIHHRSVRATSTRSPAARWRNRELRDRLFQALNLQLSALEVVSNSRSVSQNLPGLRGQNQHVALVQGLVPRVPPRVTLRENHVRLLRQHLAGLLARIPVVVNAERDALQEIGGTRVLREKLLPFKVPTHGNDAVNVPHVQEEWAVRGDLSQSIQHFSLRLPITRFPRGRAAVRQRHGANLAQVLRGLDLRRWNVQGRARGRDVPPQLRRNFLQVVVDIQDGVDPLAADANHVLGGRHLHRGGRL